MRKPWKWMNKKKTRLLAGPYLVWIIGFTLLPMITVVLTAFTGTDGHFTLSYLRSVGEHVHIAALLLSLVLALVTTAICLILSFPLALILRSLKIKNQGIVVFLFMLPMWINFLLRIMAWKMILAKNGILNTFLEFLHLPALNIINTPAAIVIGMVYDYLPFMLLPVYSAIEKIKDDYIEAAYDLGADYFTVLKKIIIPLSMSGIVSGITMVFVPSLTSFAVSDILGGGKILLIGNVIEQDFMQGNQWGTGSALSFILMIFVIISMILSQLFEKEEK